MAAAEAAPRATVLTEEMGEEEADAMNQLQLIMSVVTDPREAFRVEVAGSLLIFQYLAAAVADVPKLDKMPLARNQVMEETDYLTR